MSLRVAHLWAYFGRLSERFLTEEILALQRHGAEVDIISFRPDPSASGSPKDEQLRPRVRYLEPGTGPLRSAAGSAKSVVARPWLWARGHGAFPKEGWKRAAEWLRSASLRSRLVDALSAVTPDVVHAQHGHIGWMALPVIRRMKLPMVVSLRGQDVGLLTKLAGDRLEEMFRARSRFLARCEDMAVRLRETGFPDERVFVHPSGVAVKEIGFRERSAPKPGEPIVVLSVGRLVEKKGMADAVSALASCRTTPFRTVLRIVGEGPKEAELRELVQQRGVDVRVSFLGALSHEQVLQEMSNAHLFMLASHATADGDREGIPNAIKEAAASGLPVISTRHGGIPEVVEHGVSGLLAEEGDVEGLSACLAEMVRRPADWPAMGRRGRAIVERDHDVDRLAPTLIDHYRAVLSEAQNA